MRKLKNRPTLGKGDDSMNPKRGIRTMHKFLDDLFEKRGSTRETALSSIIEGFTMNYEYQFAKENFATLLYRCLNSVEKGSSKEMGLASNALGLLAITIGCGENAHELYRVVIEPLSQVLKSGPESMISSVLGCLAIVTFVGRSNVVETERTMLIIWRFIHSELCSRVASRKYSVAILITAISAWSFLLTTMYGWNLNYNHWQGAISFFLNILKANDGSINVVAHESLALIFEVGNLEKFISGTEGTSDCANHKRMNLLHGYSSILELKEKLIIQVKSLSLQTKGESSATKVMNKKCNYSWDVLEALEDDCFPETLVKIDDQNVRLCTKSQLLQLKFVKNFLGHGFVNHMLVNELLRDVFDFTPKLLSINEPYICERKEVIVRYYDPVIRRKFRLGKNRKEIDKARAILLNKKRDVKAMELRLYDD